MPDGLSLDAMGACKLRIPLPALLLAAEHLQCTFPCCLASLPHACLGDSIWHAAAGPQQGFGLDARPHLAGPQKQGGPAPEPAPAAPQHKSLLDQIVADSCDGQPLDAGAPCLTCRPLDPSVCIASYCPPRPELCPTHWSMTCASAICVPSQQPALLQGCRCVRALAAAPSFLPTSPLVGTNAGECSHRCGRRAGPYGQGRVV